MRVDPTDIRKKKRETLVKWNRYLAIVVVLVSLIFFFIKIVLI